MDRYRRSILDRDADRWREEDPEAADLIAAYEAELRRQGLIDFDDMPLLAVRAFRQHEWVQRAILAKYPVLVVDEYQDLGTALHRMVMGLCFSTGVRLFAVGDIDQSIYGFTGANPALLQRLANSQEVETVPLRLNYRSGARIVTASQYALGEDRGYEVPDEAEESTVYFHPRPGYFEHHADHLFSELLPAALERTAARPGDIAVLYQAAWIGDAVAEAARQHGFDTIHADTNALYPRGSPLMRWLELCAVWCCGGWRSGTPRFGRILSDGMRIFAEGLTSSDDRTEFRRQLIAALWSRRQPQMVVHEWLTQIRDEVLDSQFGRCTGRGHCDAARGRPAPQLPSSRGLTTAMDGRRRKTVHADAAAGGTSEGRQPLVDVHGVHVRDAHVAIVRRPHVRAIGHANRAYEVFRRCRSLALSKYPPAKPGALVVSRSKRPDVTAPRSLEPPVTVAALIQRQLIQPPILSLLLLDVLPDDPRSSADAPRTPERCGSRSCLSGSRSPGPPSTSAESTSSCARGRAADAPPPLHSRGAAPTSGTPSMRRAVVKPLSSSRYTFLRKDTTRGIRDTP